MTHILLYFNTVYKQVTPLLVLFSNVYIEVYCGAYCYVAMKEKHVTPLKCVFYEDWKKSQVDLENYSASDA